MDTETGRLKIRDVSFVICIIVLIVSSCVYWNATMATEQVRETAESTKELQGYADSVLEKYVDVKYDNTFDAETGYHTQISLYNAGTIPATEVKITLTYPAGTQIQRIIPPIKYTESETDQGKLVEIVIQRLDVNMPLGILVTSSHEPTVSPQVRCNEDLESEGG